MGELIHGAAPLIRVTVIVMLLVLLAMIIDLGSGLAKAKERGELRTSEALRRTLRKFISYEGGISIAAMVDILIQFSQFYAIFRLDVLTSVPLVSILVGIFLLVVEFMSVREKADEKTKRQQNEAAAVLAKLITKDDMKKILSEVVKSNERNREDYGER